MSQDDELADVRRHDGRRAAIDADLGRGHLPPTARATTAVRLQHQAQIRAAAAEVEAAVQRLHEAVAAARAAGVPWSTVGETLGVTRQAVHERFGRSPSDVT